MKRMKNGIIIKCMVITAILVIIPMTVTAMGNSDKPYGEVLESEFESIATSLEAEEIDIQTAVQQLHDLRVEYKRDNNQDYQEMEKLLEAVQTREMTAIKAQEQLRLLEECNAGVENKLKQQEKTATQVQQKNTVQTRTQSAQPEPSGSGSSSSGSSTGGGTGSSNGKK